MRVPAFLVRQLLVTGSLRNEPDGFSLRARNAIGDGSIQGIAGIRVDGQAIAPESITATRDGDATVYRASDVSPTTPVVFRRGDVVTFHVTGRSLEPGDHRLEVELDERNLGRVSLAITERLHGGSVGVGGSDSDDPGA